MIRPFSSLKALFNMTSNCCNQSPYCRGALYRVHNKKVLQFAGFTFNHIASILERSKSDFLIAEIWLPTHKKNCNSFIVTTGCFQVNQWSIIFTHDSPDGANSFQKPARETGCQQRLATCIPDRSEWRTNVYRLHWHLAILSVSCHRSIQFLEWYHPTSSWMYKSEIRQQRQLSRESYDLQNLLPRLRGTCGEQDRVQTF